MDKKGKINALLHAVKSGGNLETVKVLVEQGADVHQTGMLGFDAVTIAMISDQPDIARYLTEQGADRADYDNLESERVRFIANVGKLFPDAKEEIAKKEFSLLQYLQFKTMLKISAGIENPADWQPNPELSSPEKTWAYYKKMLSEGELEKALACHLPRSAEKFREMYHNMPQKKIIKLISAIQELAKVKKNGQPEEYRLSIKDKEKTYSVGIYLTNVFGEWRFEDF
ncbi:MAG: ankyrin repeat domain-containing protein [Candidatus Electrothrix sp. GM3_4]|nr:ankyrin repeat domain-containing protein [Candidatus Electrothrix sp. GM3_4]